MSGPAKRLRGRRPLWLSLVIVVGVVAYLAARPAIEKQFGVQLPGLAGDQSPETAPAEAEKRAEPEIKQPTAETDKPSSGNTRPLGQLESLAGNLNRSTAGLLYGPGGQEGHRLAHVLRHVVDDPMRDGRHGVFEGGRDTALAVIDEAYLQYSRGDPAARSTQERGRTVITADLGRVIGYVGGRQGNRDGKPPARRVRLVLEGKKVITAYPLK